MNHRSYFMAGVDVNQEIGDMSDLISYTAAGSGFTCHFIINVPSVSASDVFWVFSCSNRVMMQHQSEG